MEKNIHEKSNNHGRHNLWAYRKDEECGKLKLITQGKMP